jgi:hypothetical protein
MQKALLFILFLIPFSIFTKAQNLITVGEIYDGTAHDIASGYDVIYLAQGRHLALLDPETGLRIKNYTDEPYPDPLVAVEFDKTGNMLFVATGKVIYIYDESSKTARVWETVNNTTIMDFQCIAEHQVMLVVLSDRAVMVDYSMNEPFVISTFTMPPGIMFFIRPHIALTRNGNMAYLTGFITGQTIRGVNGLVIVDLDSQGGYGSPHVYPGFWNPSAHYSSATATALNVQVIENYQGSYTYAFLACGHAGQLTVLDVSDPAAPAFVSRKAIHEGFPVSHIILKDDSTRLLVASSNILHSLDTETLQILGSRNAGFFDAGDRDMILHHRGDRKEVWTATHFSVDYVINAVDVTTDQLSHPVKQWWISSSDGAVAVPAWHSIYLPTFGGIVRYDVSDETRPVAINESYQPAGGTIEHIDIIFHQPDNPDQALLLTAPGNGGVQFWPVSASNPNPGPPVKVKQNPSQWGNAQVYQNDVGYFRKDGINYFLADLANRTTNEVALQIYNTISGDWINVFEQSTELKANAHAILVYEEYAFVTCNGGFFVVDLSQLPHTASIVDLVVNDWNEDGKPNQTNGIMIRPDGAYVFVAHDPGVVQSFAFDKATGKVTGPLHVLHGEGITGCTNRGRYFGALDRLYIAGRGGNIMEIDARDPYDLKLLSVWNNGAYKGEMQDCHIYDFGKGPRILAVKNNEGFALLKIEDYPLTAPANPVQTPRIITLYDPYPNPFRDETTIGWLSDTGGHTMLNIIDTKGRIVKTLINTYYPPGEYTCIFRKETLPQGIYYAQLRIGNRESTKMMLIIR